MVPYLSKLGFKTRVKTPFFHYEGAKFGGFFTVNFVRNVDKIIRMLKLHHIVPITTANTFFTFLCKYDILMQKSPEFSKFYNKPYGLLLTNPRKKPNFCF